MESEKTFTEEQVLKIIELARQTIVVEGIRFPIPTFTADEIIYIIENDYIK